MSKGFDQRKKRGYTLIEMLVVIAIIVVLIGLTIIAASSLLASMRQNKLDTIAQDIYVTAQERLTEMYTDDRVDELTMRGSTAGMFALAVDDPSVKPKDWDSSITYAGLTSFYNKPASDVAAVLLPAGALSAEVNGNHWIIEYNPDYGYIYAVYYSEKAFSPAEIAEWYSSGKADTYRTYADRKGSGVGYYGGGGVLGGKVTMTATSLNVSLNLINAEELKAELSVRIPTQFKERPVRVKMVFTGEESDRTNEYSLVMTSLNYGYFNRETAFIFDSFNKASGRSQQFGDNTDMFTGMYAGENVTLKISAELGMESVGTFTPDTSLDTAESTLVFNGLFESYDADTNTAYVSAGRHLQNLNNINYRVDVTKVVQNGNIDFENTTPDEDDDAIFWWAETYPGRTFVPVNNDKIVSVKGSNEDADGNVVCYIINGMTVQMDESSTDPAGLFGVLGETGAAVTVEDVSLVGSKVTSDNGSVGALAGKADGNITLKNTGAYLARDDYNNMTYNSAVTALKGRTVGGLIGEVTENITANECYAAEVLRGSYRVGGLFGAVSGKMALSRSYADCYMSANGGSIGGLAANCGSSSTIENCYSAGFTVGMPAASAGFVPAEVAVVKNSYSVLNIGPNDDTDGTNITVTTQFYATVASGDATNVYYALPEGVVYDTNKFVSVGTPRTFSQLRGANAVKPAVTNLASSGSFRFTSVTGDTTAYNLAAGLGLTNYPYPFIYKDGSTVLHHYGDWDGNLFDPGTLVYFEEYADGKFGYYGAGSNYLDSGKTVVRDGYALLYSRNSVEADPYYGTADPAVVTFAERTYEIPVIVPENDRHTVVKRSITGRTVEAAYYFRELPYDLVNSPDAASADSFYSYIKVETPDTRNDDNQGVSYYYFNPHFAATVEQVETAASPAPTLAGTAKNIIRIRTPRHLNLLSTYFDGHSKALTAGVTLDQEMTMDYGVYEWTKAGYTAAVTVQKPIANGVGTHQFNATYNGNAKVITGVDFMSDTLYSGMFGYVGATGRLNSIVIAAEAQNGHAVGYSTAPQERNNYAYIGVLAGYNVGTINNCATAGYKLTADSYNTTLYVGGLVGYNNKNIYNSAAETPELTARTNACNAFVGSFVGSNGGNGFVIRSYSLSSLDVSRYISGTVRVSGFAGSNAGTVQSSYTVTAMTVSNIPENNVDGFTPAGGSVQSCYFLTNGTYKFNGGVYAYGQTSQTAREVEGVAQMPGNGTVTLGGFGKATANNTLYHGNTSAAAGDVYPFATAVTNEGGFFTHYGDWISEDVLGNAGMLYWEHEQNGTNAGYHFYVLDKNNNVVSTLCDSHDDGGVITEYGYGYYKINSTMVNIGTPTFGNIETAKLDSYIDNAAITDLEQQFAGAYNFVLYKTSSAFADTPNGMYVTGENAYATATVDGKTYSFSPFFGATLKAGSDAPTQMQVRSIDQLQFLNWNQGYTTYVKTGTVLSNTTYEEVYQRRNTPYFHEVDGELYQVTVTKTDNNRYTLTYNNGTTIVSNKKGNNTLGSNVTLYTAKLQKESGNTRELVTKDNYKTFTYLGQASVTGKGTQTKSTARNKVVFDWTWTQTHDIKLDASVTTGFTPIAAAATSTPSNSYDAVLYAWFGSTFNGQSYKIEDINIKSGAFTVGLFGVTAGADMRNVIMYSENNAAIIRETSPTDPIGAYSLGGLVGVVYDYNNAADNKELINCAIAGYRIIDNSKNQQTRGETNVGGLTGVCNGNLRNCSAVTDIKINCTHKNANGQFTQATYGNYIRVGGVTGATLGILENCYSGGSISVGSATLDENYHGTTYVSTTSKTIVDYNNGGTHVYVAGIGGSGFAQNYHNFSNISGGGGREGSPSFKNCYTYINFPKMEGTIRSISIIGSLADRYRYGDHVSIESCYYLDAIIDEAKMLSNLPKFYYNDDVTDVYSTLTDNNSKYFWEMLNGTSVAMNKLFRDDTTSKITNKQLTEKTMEQLSALPINGWSKVTTVENGATINGKYSFPGSDHELDGRNYPFPAIVTQTSDATGKPVFVHYGTWPKGNGLYSSNSNITLDLLTDDADSKEVILTNYKDYKKDPVDLSKLSFVYSEMDEEGVVKNDLPDSTIVQVTHELQSDGTVKLTVLGLKEGTATVTAVYNGNKEAEIQVTVVADFSIQVVPVNVTFDDSGKIDSVQDVEGPTAIPVAYQQDKLYWKLTAKNANGDPIDPDAVKWRVEQNTIDPNFDNFRIVKALNGDIILEFSSLAIRTHDIQVTAFDVAGVSDQTITGTRSLEVQFKVIQNPPVVVIYRYPQNAASNEVLMTIYQLSANGNVSYAADKTGKVAVEKVTVGEAASGYDAFTGYVLADSWHPLTNDDGEVLKDDDGNERWDYDYFTDENGEIKYTTVIDNYQKTLVVYGQWTVSEYNISYETVYDDVSVSDDAMKTYTMADAVVLPDVSSMTVVDTQANQTKAFTGWKVTSAVEDSGWDTAGKYIAGEQIERGKHGDVTFTAVWNTVCSITYYPADSDIPYDNVGATATYVSNSDSISLYTPPASDAQDGTVFIGWKLKNADTPAVEGWQANVIYKNPVTGASGFSGDVELEAVWGVSYDITYQIGENPAHNIVEQYAVGYSYAFAAAPGADLTPAGWRFTGWKLTEADHATEESWVVGKIYQPGETIDNTNGTYTGAVTLTAEFELGSYTITYDADGGSTTPDPVTYLMTDTITIAPAVEKDEFIFKGWKADGSGNWGDEVYEASRTLYNKYGNVTLTAQWESKVYNVIYDTNDGTLVGEDGDGWKRTDDNLLVTPYTYYSGVTLVEARRHGYTFQYWDQTTDMAENTSWTDHYAFGTLYTGKTGDVYMKANWEPTNYTITYKDYNGDTLEEVTYTIESAPDVKALPTMDGYNYSSWKVISKGEDCNWTEDSVDAAVVLTGHYGDVTLQCERQAIEYTITYLKPDDTQVEVQNYTRDKANVVIAEAPGYEEDGKAQFFTGWTVTAAEGNWSTQGKYQPGEAVQDMFGNVTLTAQFETRSLTLSAEKEGSVNVYFVKPGADGATFAGYFAEAYTAPTKTGWTLDGWYTAPSATGTKVLDANGAVVGANVDGFTADGKLNLTNQSIYLYAKWKRTGRVLTPVTTLTDNPQVAIGAVSGNNLTIMGMNKNGNNYSYTVVSTSEAGEDGVFYLFDNPSDTSILWKAAGSGTSFTFMDTMYSRYMQRLIGDLSNADAVRYATEWTVQEGRISSSSRIIITWNTYYVNITDSGVSLVTSNNTPNRITFYTVTEEEVVRYD